MRRTALTMRRLLAIENALSSMLAGQGPGEGDWSEDVTSDDMEAAMDWCSDQIEKRERNAS